MIDDALRDMIERILDHDVSDVDAALSMIKAGIIKRLDAEELSVIKVLRSIMQIRAINAQHADIVEMLVSNPTAPIGDIASAVSLSRPRVSQILHGYADDIPWLDMMLDIRRSLIIRRARGKKVLPKGVGGVVGSRVSVCKK